METAQSKRKARTEELKVGQSSPRGYDMVGVDKGSHGLGDKNKVGLV